MKYDFNGFTPDPHQLEAMRLAWDKPAFALFHWMGRGKTFTTIHLGNARYRAGQINSILVICKTSLKYVWRHEMDKWLKPDEVNYLIYPKAKHAFAENWIRNCLADNKLNVLVLGIESLSQGKPHPDRRRKLKIPAGKTLDNAKLFLHLTGGRTMCLLDESHYIKTPNSIRTRAVIELGSYCDYRMPLTGTPVDRGIENLYSTFQFMDGKILDCPSYFVFKNRYCVLGGFENKQIIGYQFQEDFYRRVCNYVHVVEKDNKNLPPTTKKVVYVEPSPEQKSLIQQLKTVFQADHEGKKVEVSNVLTLWTRYHQILGGYFPTEDGPVALKENPKLDALLDIVEPLDEKVVIWCRFKPEIEAVVKALRKTYGLKSVVEFHGGIGESDRAEATRLFQEDDCVRFMVSNPQTGGEGNTWIAGTVVIYYSNTFSYKDRVQSAERTHRRGQTNPVAYVDVVMEHPADLKLQKVIGEKQDMATAINQNMAEFIDV